MSERFFPDSMPPALANTTSLPWWQAAAEHRLVVQHCTACDHTRHPPAPLCPECRSTESDWKEIPGRGEVYTYTIVHRPIAAGQDLPYLVAVISLEESGGLRMISNLVDVSPEAVEIGLPVEVVWEDMSANFAVPRFRPARREP
jgi:uncharacterized OB-fold protein